MTRGAVVDAIEVRLIKRQKNTNFITLQAREINYKIIQVFEKSLK
jgi:hypothetical protein